MITPPLVIASTEPVIENVIPSLTTKVAGISVAVALPTAVAPSSTTNVEDEVNTGAVESTTLTVLVSVAELQEASEEVYVIV